MTDIPITANERKAQFTGNTGLGPFAFTFNILATSDIRVIKNSTVLTLTSEYTVTTNANGTGSITLTGSGNGTALISTDILTIIGNRQLARTSDYVQGGNLFAGALNEDLDSIVIMMQQLDEKVSRTMRIDAGDIGQNLLLPSQASRLGRTLQFNASTGNPEAGPTATDVANAQTNATNAAASASAAASSASAASGSASSAASSAASAAASAANQVAKTSSTGSAVIPTGTQAQRDGSPSAGYFRFNSDVNKFEGYSSSGWGSVGGGAVGGGPDAVFVENDKTVTTNYTITTNKNAMSTGPITVNSGITVTVPSGSNWVIL